MTLGTNATLSERLIYAPDEITHEEIFSMAEELDSWHELSDREIYTPSDVVSLDDQLDEYLGYKSELVEWRELRLIGINEPVDVEDLHAECYEKSETISELEDEIERLNEIIKGLEDENFELRTN